MQGAKVMEKKVIMISGANRGLGKCLAKAFYDQGYYVSLGVRQPESIQSTDNMRMLVTQYDAKVPATSETWLSNTIKTFGQVDGLINNAGIAHSVRFGHFDSNLLDEMWDVNVKAPFFLTEKVMPYLKQTAGRLINISSCSAKNGITHAGTNVGNTMTKKAVLSLSEVESLIGWDDGVSVTTICPAYVNTDMPNHPNIPRDKMIQPEDLARLIVFLFGLPSTLVIDNITIRNRE